MIYEDTTGIYHGNVVFNQTETITDAADIILHEDLRKKKTDDSVAISIGLTEFHFVLLYPDRIVCVCRLNKQRVYEEFFPRVTFLRKRKEKKRKEKRLPHQRNNMDGKGNKIKQESNCTSVGI